MSIFSSSSEGKCVMTNRVCPRKGMIGESPSPNATTDYCPAWLEIHHQVSEVQKLQTGMGIEKREGCAFGLLPFLFNGAITASNIARAETIALRKEENVRSNALGQAVVGILGAIQERREPISSLPPKA